MRKMRSAAVGKGCDKVRQGAWRWYCRRNHRRSLVWSSWSLGWGNSRADDRGEPTQMSFMKNAFTSLAPLMTETKIILMFLPIVAFCYWFCVVHKKRPFNLQELIVLVFS